MNEPEELSSWLESRRLIISKLSSMETDIREYGQKVDRVFDIMRDRHNEFSEKTAAQMTELKVHIAMLEVKIKIWSASIGCLAGGAVAALMDFLTKRP